MLFTDWQGDADELLVADDPDSAVVEVLARADERGVDVRGLIWRSHWDKVGFFSRENRTLGEELQQRGAEALLDMRVRNGGSHHQKFVVIRHRDDPDRATSPSSAASTWPTRAATTTDTSATRRTSHWPRSTATGRRGTTRWWRSPGRPSTTSRPRSGSAGRTRRR